MAPYRDLLPQALDAYEIVRRLPAPAALAPGPYGDALIARFHHAAFAQCTDAAQLIRFATENNGLVIYRRLDDARSLPVIDGYLDWLERNGTPLAGFPHGLAETSLASPAVICQRRGRAVSASFLWHLCIHARLRGHLHPRTILEIGGGFGGLARLMALADPQVRQVLVDLPETLVFAHAYLAATLPEARIVFATSHAEVTSAECDILLVPTALLDALTGQSFDLAVNVASLGEMTASAMAGYMDFLHDKVSVGHFYSVNQFGEFAPESAAGRGRRLTEATRSSLQLDCNWDIIHWDRHGENGFAQIDPLAAPSLEVLLGRHMRDDAQCDVDARRCAEAAASCCVGSGPWHRWMWEAALLRPLGEEAVAYAEYCRRLGWREYA